MKKICLALYAILVVVVSGAVSPAAPAKEVNLNVFMNELQQWKTGTEHGAMVWWMPDEWWIVNAKSDPTMNEAMLRDILRIVDDYMIFVVSEGRFGAFGGFNPESRERIVSRMIVVLHTGAELRPLANDDLGYDLQNFFGAMKPVLSNLLGQVGRGMEFVAFTAPVSEGKKLVDARESGGFVVRLGEQEFKWRLPLASLLPEKLDPKTGEYFPGNYQFNPFTGDPLQAGE